MNPDFYSRNKSMPFELNTIDDWIAILQTARDKVGGNVEVRLVSEDYVNDSDEYRVPEDVILRGSQSLIHSKSIKDSSTYFVITY